MRFSVIVLLFLATQFYCQQNNLINGVFECTKSLVFDGTSQQPVQHNSAIAYFTYTPMITIPPRYFKKAGDVKLNEKPFDRDKDSVFYFDNSNQLDFTSMNWKVSGHKEIPNMNFIYSGPFPAFNSTVILPDTVSKSDTLLIHINGINDADTIVLNIWDKDSQGINRKYIEFKFSSASETIGILPEWISSLTLGNRSYLSVEIVNYNYQSVSGMNFLFRNIRSIIKPNIIIIN